MRETGMIVSGRSQPGDEPPIRWSVEFTECDVEEIAFALSVVSVLIILAWAVDECAIAT